MKFSALSPEEKAFFVSATDEPGILESLSERVRCSMTASLGVPVCVSSARGILPSSSRQGKSPKIMASRELENAWVSVRFGGCPGAADRQVQTGLSDSLMRTLKRALAESVINLGKEVAWPEAVRLELVIQEQEGAVEFLCEPQHLMNWARAELERTQ
jgi:hypothetical protein